MPRCRGARLKSPLEAAYTAATVSSTVSNFNSYLYLRKASLRHASVNSKPLSSSTDGRGAVREAPPGGPRTFWDSATTWKHTRTHIHIERQQKQRRETKKMRFGLQNKTWNRIELVIWGRSVLWLVDWCYDLNVWKLQREGGRGP